MWKESLFEVRVVCYSGYRGDETPRKFYLGERRIEIATVIDRWLSPEHRYFKLLSTDADIYILRHDSSADLWELTLFESRDNPGKMSGSDPQSLKHPPSQ